MFWQVGHSSQTPKAKDCVFAWPCVGSKKQLLNVCTWHHRTPWEGNSHQRTCRWATVTLLMFTSFFCVAVCSEKWHHHLSNSHYLPGDQGKNGQKDGTSSSGSSNSDEESSDCPEPVETKAEEPGPTTVKEEAWPTPQASAAAKKGARPKARSWSQVVTGQK